MTKQIVVINILDEKQRLKEVKYRYEERLTKFYNTSQFNTHGYSYLGARDAMKSMGFMCGLDYRVQEEVEEGET